MAGFTVYVAADPPGHADVALVVGLCGHALRGGIVGSRVMSAVPGTVEAVGEVTHMDVSYLRLLIARPDGPARLGAVSWSERDPSIYLFPPSGYARYRYGRTEIFGPGETQFDLSDLIETSDLPKLSIHATGEAHVRAKTSPGSEPTFVGPLQMMRGQHVAVITVESIAGLPDYPLAKLDRERKGERNVVVRPPPGTEHFDGVRVHIYLNALEQQFACDPAPPIRGTLTRAGFSYPMHVGVLPDLGEPPDGARTGVSLLGGWNPHVQSSRALLIIGGP